eukprot:Clim_evm23s9 gene=Clim_evmTU23s9
MVFHIKYAAPTLVTLAAISCGMTSIRMALQGRFETSIWTLFAAMVFDGLDGHVARALGASTKIGAELDSLCDLVDFGAAPSLVMYSWASLNGSPDNVPDEWLWASCVVYICMCATRLARFNVLNNEHAYGQEQEKLREQEEAAQGQRAKLRSSAPAKPQRGRLNKQNGKHSSQIQETISYVRTYILVKERFFEGVPAPMACWLALFPMLWRFQYGENFMGLDARVITVGTNLLVAAMMVTPFPTLSSKMLMRNPQTESHLVSRTYITGFLKVAVVAGVVAFAYAEPWLFCVSLELGYVALFPLGIYAYYFVALPEEHTKLLKAKVK